MASPPGSYREGPGSPPRASPDSKDSQDAPSDRHLHAGARLAGVAAMDELASQRWDADRGPARHWRKGGVVPTAVCLCKAAIGAGVLSMASHSAETGTAFNLVALVLGGILTVQSIRMIGSVSLATGRWSFEDICDELFHPALAVVTGFINASNCLGSAAAYLIISGQIFQVLAQSSDRQRTVFVILVGLCVCLPLSLARHVNFMRHLAMVSVAALVFLVFAVVVLLGQYGEDPTITSQTFWNGPGDASVYTYMNGLNIVVFAYNNQFNVPQLTGELRPQTMPRVSRVALLSTFLIFMLYMLVSVFGVLTFGVGSNQKETLVLNLEPHRKYWLAVAALAAVMFSTLMCFEFHIYPIRQFLAYCVRKYRGRAAGADEAADALCCGQPTARCIDIVCAAGSVATAITIAVALSSLRQLLDFIGAFAAAYISFIIPPLWVVRLRSEQADFSWADPAIFGSVAMLLLGAFFFVFGTYAAILQQ